MPANRQKQAPKKRKANRTSFKPGQSGNPDGRPKGIVALARELTDDGRTMLEVLNEIALGRMRIPVGEVEVPPTVRERMDAAEKLISRIDGMPRQALQHDAGENASVSISIIRHVEGEK